MKNRSLVLVGMIMTLLAGIINGQTGVEIHAASSTAVSGWKQMSSPSGDALWVAPDVRLTSADFERAQARKQQNGDPAVAVVLTDAGAKKMAELSSAQLDKPIAMILDGQVIWAPIVRSAGMQREALLTGGPGGLTQQQIDRLLASFKTK